MKKYTIEICKNILHGHLATNIVMVYGKANKQYMAEQIITLLENLEYVTKATYVEPGFINIFINPHVINHVEDYWHEVTIKKNINISVEYASPNPTGPCHIGHARGSIVGDIIASILIYLGYNVRKDCIFNDGGKQVEKFIESIYIRYKELQNKASPEELINIFYKGEYIKDLALYYRDQNIPTFMDFTHNIDEIMERMKAQMGQDLALLHIYHDTVTRESKLREELKVCWEKMDKLGLLEREYSDKGVKIFFKSKDFTDDKDRVIEREDGSITYFGNDIAYHWTKKTRLSGPVQFNKQIIVLGDDHIGYLKRLLGAVKTFDIDLCVVTHNLVKIMKNGEEFKMSKRNGNFITIRDFIEKIGNNDILRILMMEYGPTSPVYLNLDKLNLEDSPLFYIQYAHVRLTSIFKKQQYDAQHLNLDLLCTNEDIQLISYLVYWPSFITMLGNSLDIHGLFIFLQSFSKLLHSYFSQHTVLSDNILLTNSRLYLMDKCYKLLKIIGNIIKITLLESM